MNLALWIITGILAAVFLIAAANKMFVPKEKLAAAPGGGWVRHFSTDSLRTIGILEILGVAGLILPAVLHIAPVLVPLAAVGLALVMVGAIVMRLRLREGTTAIFVDMTYLALAIFVAWCRFGPNSLH